MACENVMAEAEALCRDRGARLTAARRRALQAMITLDRPVKAYELLPWLGNGGAPAKPATAYRALSFFEGLGLVHRLAAINAFVLCGSGGGEHATALFVCESCGRATERPRDDAVAENPPDGFVVSRSFVEHYGRCAACATTPAS